MIRVLTLQKFIFRPIFSDPTPIKVFECPCDLLSFIFREMVNANGHVKFKKHYGKVHVQLSGGNCKMWRSEVTSEDGGWLSTDVYVDIIEQTWHANLKVVNLFVPVKSLMNARWS